jgi:hypothetical protein
LSKKTKTVRVEITAWQRVQYIQTITLDVEEWQRIKSIPEQELAERGGEMASLLDLSDVVDADDFEDDFEMRVVDKKGKPVKPKDQYNGGEV